MCNSNIEGGYGRQDTPKIQFEQCTDLRKGEFGSSIPTVNTSFQPSNIFKFKLSSITASDIPI